MIYKSEVVEDKQVVGIRLVAFYAKAQSSVCNLHSQRLLVFVCSVCLYRSHSAATAIRSMIVVHACIKLTASHIKCHAHVVGIEHCIGEVAIATLCRYLVHSVWQTCYCLINIVGCYLRVYDTCRTVRTCCIVTINIEPVASCRPFSGRVAVRTAVLMSCIATGKACTLYHERCFLRIVHASGAEVGNALCLRNESPLCLLC